jgi:hypothetical protein
MSNYKVTEIKKLDISNIPAIIHAVLEKENLDISENKFYYLCEGKFEYDSNHKEVTDLNGEDLFEYVKNMNLEWEAIEDLTP